MNTALVTGMETRAEERTAVTPAGSAPLARGSSQGEGCFRSEHGRATLLGSRWSPGRLPPGRNPAF